jgi:PHP family Zn ribbon phosphoesterase
MIDYVNLSEEDVDGEFLRMAGLSKEEKKAKLAEGLKPKPCYHCGEENMHNALNCYKCGSILDPAIADKIEEYMRRARQLPEYQAYLKKLSELE